MAEQAADEPAARGQGGSEASALSACPAGPMTYTELTESGLGPNMPELLWVPYFSGPSDDQLNVPNNTAELQHSGQDHEGIRRELSRSIDSIGGGRTFRSLQGVRLEEGKTIGRSWSQRKAAASAMGSPIAFFPEPSSKWDSLPEPIMHIIFGKTDLKTQQKCRLVSKYWKHLINNNLKAVQPSKPRIHVLQKEFTRLVSVDFSRCEQLRNRNLHVFATSKLKIEELVIGHIIMGLYSKPRITNAGIAYIASMTSLKKLTFIDCNAFTNAGIEKLSPLTNLEELSFIRCTRISERGMEFLKKLPKLRSLTVFMCTKVTDVLLGMLREMPALKQLHLGHVRLTRERLEDLNTDSKSELEELTVHGVEITAGSLIALGLFKSLKALGMTACYQVDVQLSLTILMCLSNLERVNLLSIEETNNQHLIDLSNNLPHLQHLKIVLSPQITGAGIEALAGLSSLQACCFESSQASPQALHAVSSLRGLTSAEFPGTSIPAELLNALPYLTKLQRLSLRSHQREVVVVSGQPLWIGSIEPLLRCMCLKSLDMSYTDMNITLVNALLSKLVSRDRGRKLDRPVLEELCMQGCVITDQAVELMNKCFPSVLCHRTQPAVLESSTWVHSSSNTTHTS